MTFALDIADDLTTVVDGLRSVTLRTDQNVAVQAMSVELRTSEVAASGGRYLAGDERFHVQANALGSARAPRPGDSITDDDGTVFTVLECSRVTVGTRYSMVCRKLNIVGDRTEVTLQRAIYKTGATGAKEVDCWETIRAGVTAWIAPKARATESETGQKILKPVFTVYLQLPDLRPESHWRIIDANGKGYRIVTVSGEQRLDQMVELTAEEHRWLARG